MFDLNEAINRWRESLALRESCRKPDIDELESHLREETENLAGSKLSEEEAFLVATHRLGDAKDLAVEFAKINSGTVWGYRFFWMATGLFAYIMLDYCSGVMSKTCTLIAALGGLNGYGLGIVNISTKVLILGGMLLLLYKAARRVEYSAWLDRLAGCRKGRILLFVGLSVGVLVLRTVMLLISATTARLVGPQIYAEMSILVLYPSAIWSLVFPVLLALLAIRLRPSRLEQAEA